MKKRKPTLYGAVLALRTKIIAMAILPHPPPEPEPTGGLCNDDCKRKIAIGAGVGGSLGGGYIIYRCIRQVPSFFPPLWPTFVPNLLAP